jgi:biopolymer transport protein ExbB
MRFELRFDRLLAVLCAMLIGTAHAQVNDDWKHRAKLALDTTASGVPVKSALQQFVAPVRLHTGNFDFRNAMSDGRDVRFLGQDGKTVLPHRIEVWDASNDLAVVWVQLPTLAPNTKDAFIWIASGNPKAEAPAAVPLADPRTVLSTRFGEPLRNDAGDGVVLEATGATTEPLGIAGAAMKLGPNARLAASGAGLRFGADGTTLMAWVQLPAAEATGGLLTLKGATTVIDVALARGVPTLTVTGAAAAPGQPTPKGPLTGSGTAAISPSQWHHLALVAGERVALFIDGAEVASVAARVGDQPLALGAGGGAVFDLDELTVATVARSPEWIRVSQASQGPEAALVALADEGGGEISHFKILVDNLTLDGKIVIYVLLVMFVIATWVIIAKAISLSRAARANTRFLEVFRSAGDEAFLAADFGAASAAQGKADPGFAGSPLHAMFEAASQQVRQRVPGGAVTADAARGTIGDKAMNSIRAAIDATVVRENNRLNRLIVLLTIAISGGPFIGLLGTVVGVMITFAAIAAVGDININSIAPGIAAALLATVAGLAVAIPALFAYNWLASKIKELVSEMQIFGDELTSRIAEAFER